MDCKGCKLLVTTDHEDFCAIRDLQKSTNCPCSLCLVKMMCNNRVNECPIFLNHLREERERCGVAL